MVTDNLGQYQPQCRWLMEKNFFFFLIHMVGVGVKIAFVSTMEIFITLYAIASHLSLYFVVTQSFTDAGPHHCSYAWL